MKPKRKHVRQNYKGGEGSAYLSFRECEGTAGNILPKEHFRLHPREKEVFRDCAKEIGRNLAEYRRFLNFWFAWYLPRETEYLRTLRKADPFEWSLMIYAMETMGRAAQLGVSESVALRVAKFQMGKLREHFRGTQMALH